MENGNPKIWVEFKMEGFHNWPEAPDSRDYLRASHRHMFHVRVETEVTHDDREIEFHDLMDAARGQFPDIEHVNGRPDLGSMSCEMIARKIANGLAGLYARPFCVDVSEDGECGARVTCA